ncbi:MAG: TIGR04282 family arsenosugar biosynthesis glycosyltransferase [Lutibacter sp.]|nr:TIGR04282 family arsenosugar biosynthesis glycosyltransferase [Lutibacter sp.]MDT8416318.1 TIGR04282 family arsenosugar biosynthesis glycosyltransferase [Lutibacter sp.]
MKTDALIIFTRNPELGKVKTRLAATIGDEKALEVYKHLLLHTKSETKLLACDKFVFYDTSIIENDIWPETIYQKKIQSGEDLGEKMYQAFELLFSLGYKNCLIVGSDLFDLKKEIIDAAFQKLQENDVVIGPAEDGGYYLLGLKKLNSALFKNKDWGTSTVLTDTLKDLNSQSVFLMETLNDIDTFEDLKRSNYEILQKKFN